MGALACLLIEDVATALGNVGWRIYWPVSAFTSAKGEEASISGLRTMKGNSEVAPWVGDSVYSQLVGHVRHGILLMDSLRQHRHGLFFIPLGEGEAGFGQVATKNLHQAVGIAVVVDGAALAWRPDKHELCLLWLDTSVVVDG